MPGSIVPAWTPAAPLPAPAALLIKKAALPSARGTAGTPADGLSASVAKIIKAGADGRLESELPSIYEASRRGQDDAPAATDVRAEYSDFLSRLGFRDYSAKIDSALRSRRQTPDQNTVLKFNRERYRVINAARDLAAEVMAGLSEQGYSKASLENATELAARLVSLQPLDPPSSLPPEVAAQDKEGIVSWMNVVTAQKVNQHLAQVVSDVVKTVAAPEDLARFMQDVKTPGKARETKKLFRRALKIKELSELILVAAYTDAEIGQTRYAGRALAAALVRFSRNEGKPEIEEALSRKLQERGLYLENFVGDTLILHDISRPDKALRRRLRTGDFLGERSGGREAAEITFAVRPAWRLWLKAWRQNLTGRMLGFWANPKSAPRFVPGQTARNTLKFGIWKFKKWLAARPFMEKGYSHVGMVSVEEADGVAMAWALDNYPNSSAGGIRKIGITEQFSQNGPYLRLGVSRLDKDKVWEAYAAQAKENGYRKNVYESAGGRWPSLISREDFQRLSSLPKSRSAELLAELNARAVSVLEEMLSRLGVGFASGFSNEIWKAYCSSTMMLAHRMGGQFEIQSHRDMWNPVILLMKRLGIGDAKDLNTTDRIIWPGSYFIDPKIARHDMARFPEFTGVGRLPDPNTMPAYVEMDRELTAALASMARLSDEGSLELDGGAIDRAIRTHLDNRAQKSRAAGYRSGASRSSGYSAGLEALLDAGDDD